MKARKGRGLHPSVLVLLFLLLVSAGGGGIGAASGAENIDPSNDGHQYAWGENVGWINAEPSEDGGNGVEVGNFGLLGWMWGENIGWINMSCANDGVCATTLFGVTNDGYGVLSGFAWGENAGWINFAPDTCAPDPTCGVRIDPGTGYFSGRAWGENIGWMTFSPGPPEEWTARTSWCQGVAGLPGPGIVLLVGKAGSSAVLSWSGLPAASWYDVVGGTMSALRAGGGDFGAATDRCLAAKTAASSAQDGSPAPATGDGIWYLIRGANCRGRGTYDTGAASQAGSRDAKIAASADACP
jgi:hypothetical protein